MAANVFWSRDIPKGHWTAAATVRLHVPTCRFFFTFFPYTKPQPRNWRKLTSER